MASSPLCYVSSDELGILADRLNRFGDHTNLVKLLGLDEEIVDEEFLGAKALEHDKGDQLYLYRLLTSWRDQQDLGSDIRGNLAEKLQYDFPDESAFLLKGGPEDG